MYLPSLLEKGVLVLLNLLFWAIKKGVFVRRVLMFGFERHKVLLVSGLVASTLGLSACSSWFESTGSYDVTEETFVVIEERDGLPPAPLLIPRGAPIPEQAFDAPMGGGAWVERAPYNAMPARYGNSAEDIASSMPADDADFMKKAGSDGCEEDYRFVGADISHRQEIARTYDDVTTFSAQEDKKQLLTPASTSVLTPAGIKSDETAVLMRGAEMGEVVDASGVEDWLAPEGAALRSLLMDWSDRAGWKVIWKSDREYVLEAGAVFRGRYMDVASALIRTFARARPAPIATFYKGNKVLLITTLEDENAD